MNTSCSPIPQEVEHSLDWAGENRPELEKVLEHYSADPADSLKLRAVEYLIANMLFQSTQYGLGVDSLNEVYRDVYGVPDKDKERGKLFNADSVRDRRKGKVAAEYVFSGSAPIF